MPKYAVDVKAFISVQVVAPNEDAARKAAELFVDNLTPSTEYIKGYAAQQTEFGEPAVIHEDTGCFDVDGDSEVDEIDG